jgi:hypothetical protein
MFTKRDLLRSAAMTAILASTNSPLIAQTNPAWPNLFEAKAIAEEGFIYGLPLVMNYAVQYEYAVDRDSSQYKAPFNQIKKRDPCRNLQRHCHHHAQQRHAVFHPMARSARRANRAVRYLCAPKT